METNSNLPISAPSFFGRRDRQLETSTFRLAESTYGGSAELPPHSHANAHFCLVLSGSYTERLEDCEVERLPGDLIFYRAGAGHAERHHAPGRHFLIEIDAGLASGADATNTGSWTLARGASRELATRMYGEFCCDERVPSERLAALVDRLVEAVADGREGRTRPAWLGEVEAMLRELPDGSPDLVRIAAEIGVHPVYLGRAFRSVHGCTPGEYLRRLRVSRAQRALAEDADLVDIAYRAGFCDQSHLTRVFKRRTGLTPGRYRGLIAPST